MTQLRKDPVLKQWIITSPENRDYSAKLPVPQKATDPNLCPFCEGNEAKTADETLCFRTAGTPANSTGWWVRIVPDNYLLLKPEGTSVKEDLGVFGAMQATGIHEIVIETPKHDTELHNTSTNQIREVLWAYKQRLLEIKKNPKFKHFMVLKNNDATRVNCTHAHSHIVALPVIPIRLEEEIEGAREFYHYHDRCIFCEIIKQELKDAERIVLQNDDFIVFCPFASRFPYELQLMPKNHEPFFEAIENPKIQSLADILIATLKKVEMVLPKQPCNYVLHTSPCSDSYKDFYHWHIELTPKFSKPSGHEWGSGFYINDILPEAAAKLYRETKE